VEEDVASEVSIPGEEGGGQTDDTSLSGFIIDNDDSAVAPSESVRGQGTEKFIQSFGSALLVEIYGRNVALLWPKLNIIRIGNVKYMQPVLDRCWIYAS
jgi:hypothetical protein